MSRIELFELLHTGLAQMDQPVTRVLENELIRYIELIGSNNRLYNLTSIRDLDTMVVRHLLDSLSIRPFLKGKLVLDVGTGAGLPGIPLAITMPDRQFILLDSNQKKTRFLQQTVYQLRLRNVKIMHQRIEDYYPDELFDAVICRSFGTLPEFLRQTQHVLAPQSQLCIMKGVYPLTEIQEIKPPFKLVEVHPLKVPHLDAERHLVEVAYSGAEAG